MGQFFGDVWIPDQDEGPHEGRERYPPVSQTEQGHYAFLHAVGVCAVSGMNVPLEIEHLRDFAYDIGKPEPGMARKPHYAWCIPLTAEMHQRRHQIGSSAAFEAWNWPIEDLQAGPLPAALVLFGMSCMGDTEAARRWLRHCAQMRASR